MTDKELTQRAKTLRGNLRLSGEKINFADACKIVLLSDFLQMRELGAEDLYDTYKSMRPWWRLFW
jgi:hypothetical protein